MMMCMGGLLSSNIIYNNVCRKDFLTLLCPAPTITRSYRAQFLSQTVETLPLASIITYATLGGAGF